MTSNKYRLNHHAKVFARVHSRQKNIQISQQIYDTLTPRQCMVIERLRDMYNYSIQLVIA